MARIWMLRAYEGIRISFAWIVSHIDGPGRFELIVTRYGILWEPQYHIRYMASLRKLSTMQSTIDCVQNARLHPFG